MSMSIFVFNVSLNDSYLLLVKVLTERTIFAPLYWMIMIFIDLINMVGKRKRTVPADIYLFKVFNGNTRTIYKICSKSTIKTTERRH